MGSKYTTFAKREVEDDHDDEPKAKRGRPAKGQKSENKVTIKQLTSEKQSLADYCEETFRVACNMLTLADTVVANLKDLVTSIADPTPQQQKIIRSIYFTRLVTPKGPKTRPSI